MPQSAATGQGKARRRRQGSASGHASYTEQRGRVTRTANAASELLREDLMFSLQYPGGLVRGRAERSNAHLTAFCGNGSIIPEKSSKGGEPWHAKTPYCDSIVLYSPAAIICVGRPEELSSLHSNGAGDGDRCGLRDGQRRDDLTTGGVRRPRTDQIDRALARLKQGTYGLCEVAREDPSWPAERLALHDAVHRMPARAGTLPGLGRPSGRSWEKVYDAANGMDEPRDMNLAVSKSTCRSSQ